MEIIEQFRRGKISDEKCEDTLVTTTDFLGIVDGVTAKSPFWYQGKTTGKWASTLIAQTIAEADSATTLPDLLRQINGVIQRFYEQVPFPYDRVSQGLQAVAVVYSRQLRQLWLVGDCQLLVDGQAVTNPKKSDVVLGNFRSLVLATTPATTNDDLGRDAILPWILKATQFANDASTDWGYAIINGQPIPSELCRVIQLDQQPHQIVMASDGYPVLKGRLAETEAALQRVLATDPQCTHGYVSTKGLKVGNRSFDDRSYLRFNIK